MTRWCNRLGVLGRQVVETAARLGQAPQEVRLTLTASPVDDSDPEAWQVRTGEFDQVRPLGITIEHVNGFREHVHRLG
jgi:hypothetical protein